MSSCRLFAKAVMSVTIWSALSDTSSIPENNILSVKRPLSLLTSGILPQKLMISFVAGAVRKRGELTDSAYAVAAQMRISRRRLIKLII